LKLNKAKMRMMAGKPALGTVLGMGSPEVAGVLARSKFDFLLLDAQHGAWNLQTAGEALWNIGVAGHIGMVRVVKNDFFAIGSMLDRGALGVVVPMVETVEEARAAVDAARYAPQGRRSVGGSSMRSWQSAGNDGINEEIFVAVQIETRLGLERAVEILAVDGVDGCWIGPSDLALSLEVEEGHPVHEKAILQVLEACRQTGKIPGICGPGRQSQWLEAGFLFVTVGSDGGCVSRGAASIVRSYAQGPWNA
jgi:4-hydroxy-2-oxoheptanedioate aldolase